MKKKEKTGAITGIHLFTDDEVGKHHEVVFDENEFKLLDVFLAALFKTKIPCVKNPTKIVFGKRKDAAL